MLRNMLLAVVIGAAPLAAQDIVVGDPRAQLRQGIKHHETMNLKDATASLKAALRRESDLTRPEAASAYKYLAGSVAMIGLRDSAVALFREALKRDSTITLDPRVFAKVEMDAFDAARVKPRAP